MTSCCRLVLVASAVVILAGCVRSDRVLIFLEPPFWAAIEGNSLSDRLMSSGRQLGLHFDVRRSRSDDAPVRELEDVLRERTYRGVVVGPLLAREIGEISPMFDDVQFIAIQLGDSLTGLVDTDRWPMASPNNVIELRFERQDGFRRVGRLLAALEPKGTIGVISVRGRGGNVIDAFKNGYANAGGQANVDHRQLLSTRDQGEIRRVVKDLATKGINTVLLWAGPLTADGLQLIHSQGMRAVVSNLSLVGGDQVTLLAQSVLCSIDDDLITALVEVFSSLKSENTDKVMVGPTVIRWGGAAEYPDEILGDIDRLAGS